MTSPSARGRTDHAGMEVLTSEESWSLIASQPVGRLAFVAGGEPQIMPVCHVLVGRSVLFAVAVGSKLDAAVVVAPASFEVDTFDAAARTGASAVVSGWLELVDDTVAAELLDRVDPWLDGRDTLVRLVPTSVSGRRLPSR